MSYRNYVLAAYCVFALVLLWDYVAPRWQLRQQWRAARMRVARAQAARTATSIDAHLRGDDDLETRA
ncbi:heme exporter protein CcmD [Cognatiluteimonas telluris]|jgi:heme exporter protein D|uniref:heme exporter protein CcmD n=1 Tax=Cognatiluteimonas telluris TaxID=1104775 RepID=UPI00140A3139|nr:heme exporter protein CcmD [Lysobacter telluris]